MYIRRFHASMSCNMSEIICPAAIFLKQYTIWYLCFCDAISSGFSVVLLSHTKMITQRNTFTARRQMAKEMFYRDELLHIIHHFSLHPQNIYKSEWMRCEIIYFIRLMMPQPILRLNDWNAHFHALSLSLYLFSLSSSLRSDDVIDLNGQAHHK